MTNNRGIKCTDDGHNGNRGGMADIQHAAASSESGEPHRIVSPQHVEAPPYTEAK